MVNIGEYASFVGPTSTWVLITDVSGAAGLIVRTIAGLIAVVAVAVYVVKRGTLVSTTVKFIRWVLILEAVYWLSLLLAGI